MKIIRTLLLTSFMLSASFAFGQSIKSSSDKDYHLASLKTYDYKVEVRDPADPLATDTLTEQKIKEALDDALEANFYHPASEGTPDFLIAYRVTTRDMTETRRVPLRGPLGPRANIQIENYVQGTLIVDFIDPQTKKLVWRGVASGTVGRETVDPKVAEEKIKAATRLLLEQFRKDISGL
jgi:hypothetical protein